MRKQPQKLALKADTVRQLGVKDLARIAAGNDRSHNGCDPPGGGSTHTTI